MMAQVKEHVKPRRAEEVPPLGARSSVMKIITFLLESSHWLKHLHLPGHLTSTSTSQHHLMSVGEK